MTGAMLTDFVENGYLDTSVVEKFDPYYEPGWVNSGEKDFSNDDLDSLEAYREFSWGMN